MRGVSTWKDGGTVLHEKFHPLAQIGKVDADLAQAWATFKARGLDFAAIEDSAEGVLIHVTNAKYSMPTDWEVTHYDPRATLDGGTDYNGLILGEYKERVYSRHLAQTYFSAKMMGEPSLCSVTWGPKEWKRGLIRVAAQHPQNPDKIVCLVKPKPISLAHSIFGKPLNWGMKQVESLSINASGTRFGLKAGVAFGISIDADGEALKERAGGAVGYDT